MFLACVVTVEIASAASLPNSDLKVRKEYFPSHSELQQSRWHFYYSFHPRS